MPFYKIPVNVPFWSNAEDESKILVAEQRRDVMKDALGSTIRRPGLTEFATGLPDIIDGWYYWFNANLLYAVSDGSLYSIDQTGTVTLIKADVFNKGDGKKHVTWAESTDLTLITDGAVRKIFTANNSEIVEYDGTTCKQLADIDAPQQATHIIMYDNYLHANDKSDNKYDESVLYSVAADPINFEGAFYSAENHPDKLVALHTAWDEIAVFGEVQIQNFYNDGSTPFAPIPGGNVNDGTLSPWTIKRNQFSWFFLNADRKVSRIDGRQSIGISDAIDDLLEGDVDYAEAEGELFNLRGQELYLITINDRTFVYDIRLNEWVGEWSFWDKNAAKYTDFKGRNFINVKPWGKTLCTDKREGMAYELDFDVYQDFGNEIRSSVITGWIDHGTGREKQSNEFRMKIKRGEKATTATTDVEPIMLARWRDNGSKVWSNWRDIPIGFEGDNEFYYSLFQLGTYRSRQYEIICTENVPFSIVDIEEDVTLIR